MKNTYRSDEDTPTTGVTLPAVGPTPWGRVLAVVPPDRYVASERLFGGRPSIVRVEPNGMVVGHALKVGVYSGPTGLLYWLRRSKKGKWYACILAGGQWRYVGQRPFHKVANWTRVGGEPVCGAWRCKRWLTEANDLRVGCCRRCHYIGPRDPRGATRPARSPAQLAMPSQVPCAPRTAPSASATTSTARTPTSTSKDHPMTMPERSPAPDPRSTGVVVGMQAARVPPGRYVVGERTFDVRARDGGVVVRRLEEGGAVTRLEDTKARVALVRIAARANHSADKPASGRRRRGGPLALDVSNAADMAEWLRRNIGSGRLGGMFARGSDIVHTPRIGEHGYVPLADGDGDSDGPAQVRPVTATSLASRVQFLYRCHTRDAKGRRHAAMFPSGAARAVCGDVVDLLPNLRPLSGVTHTPVLRADGTVLAASGYDEATGLLHLPEPGLVVPEVPERPTDGDVVDAVRLLDAMVVDFRWLSEHDKANYFGLLLTPLLREVAPPPYMLGAIGAPQPASGKTLLASILRILHGGVVRSEFPEDDAELRKAVTTILAMTTGPVVNFDNVSGVLGSSTLSGLLTSGRWDDRLLGGNRLVSCNNDRLWIVTGNNLKLGGDLIRRTVWVTIDPKVPHPELRTDFAIPELESWVQSHRGDLLAALLTIVRAWAVAGRPTRERRGSGGFSRWLEAVDGILAHAGVSGTFVHQDSARQSVGEGDDDWRDFLAAAHEVFGSRRWTARDLLAEVEVSPTDKWGRERETRGITLDELPGDLGERVVRSGGDPLLVTKSLGRWLSNREGRYAGSMVVRKVGKRDGTKLWQIEVAEG